MEVVEVESSRLSTFQMVFFFLRVNQLSMTGAILQRSFIRKYFLYNVQNARKKNELHFLSFFSYFKPLFVAVNLNCSGEERVTI